MEPHGGRGGNNNSNKNRFDMFPCNHHNNTNNNNINSQEMQQPLSLNSESLEAFLAASQMGLNAGLVSQLLSMSGNMDSHLHQQVNAGGGFDLQPHSFHSGAQTSSFPVAGPAGCGTWGRSSLTASFSSSQDTNTTASTSASASTTATRTTTASTRTRTTTPAMSSAQNSNSSSNSSVSTTAEAAAASAPVFTPAPATPQLVPTLFGKPVIVPGMRIMPAGAAVSAASNNNNNNKNNTKSAPATTTSSGDMSSVGSAAFNNKKHRRPRRTSNGSCSTTSTSLGKRTASAVDSALAVSDDEEEGMIRRRQDRNAREQQRSHQINEHIAQLRDVLVKADLRFKPDKFTTLATVAQYITTLQTKQKQLEQEHEQLIQTMQQTAKYMSRTMAGEAAVTNDACETTTTPPNETDLGIDYKTIFTVGGYPMFGTSINSIEGRFLDCNPGFEQASGFSRHELLPLQEQGHQGQIGEDGIGRNLSLFNVLARQDMERVFTSMSNMMRQPPPSTSYGDEDTWTTIVTLCRKPNQRVQLCLKLIRTDDNRPRLFNCTLIPQGDNGTCGALTIMDGQPLTATG